MRHAGRISAFAERIDLLWQPASGRLTPPPDLPVRLVSGPVQACLKRLDEGTVLVVPVCSGTELVEQSLRDRVPPDLPAWQARTSQVLDLALTARVVPIPLHGLMQRPEQALALVAATLHGDMTGNTGSPLPRALGGGSEDLISLLARVLLLQHPEALALERRLAIQVPGFDRPPDPTALWVAADATVFAQADLRQRLFERDLELAEIADLQNAGCPGGADSCHSALRAERDALSERLQAVLSSTSWRITGPIRRVLDAIRR